MNFEQKIKLFNKGKELFSEELEEYDGNLKGDDLNGNFPIIYAVISVWEGLGYCLEDL